MAIKYSYRCHLNMIEKHLLFYFDPKGSELELFLSSKQ